jgi:uncharacterized protein
MDLLQNPHLQTILPAFFRPRAKLDFERKTIATPDDDFLDLDYYEANQDSNKIAVIIHGLEGSSQDSYITNMAKNISKIGINSICMNLRSCSGRTNKLAKTYHSGKSEDLIPVLESIDKKYQEIYLIGFSIGGNIVLKYLGEIEKDIEPRIKKALVVSPPINLESSAIALAQPEAKIYMNHLLKNLERKVKEKASIFPEEVCVDNFCEIKNFYDYDTRYTASLNCFDSAKDYWQKASSEKFLEFINIPTTILSSYDDPFLGPECFPEVKNPLVQTNYTQTGGHLGFMTFNWKKFDFECLQEKIAVKEFKS